MDRILIRGGVPLRGTVEISGAKNAALPIMAASLLTNEPLQLHNVPDLADIASMQRLLQHLGVSATYVAGEPGGIVLHAPEILSDTAPYDLVRKMRASVLVLGPLVARTGQARVSLPGGCAIGPRPIDLHLMGLERLGATIELVEGYVQARAPQGLKGAEIRLPQPSVGATENLMMAAALAKGATVIAGAAREPEIVDLADCLNAMGAKITGAGTSFIEIEGVPALHGAVHRIIPDRIEAGTYAMAAAITGGRIVLGNARLDFFGAAKEVLEEAGMMLEETDDGLVAGLADGGLRGTDAMTRPFPGFATDLQAQFMALMCVADGAAMITETIFENRFMHVPELARLGARINVHGASALVRGVKELKGAPVMATDLRASVSLVLAGLAAKGQTEINRIYHLDRGYERLEEKLGAVGAQIERVP
ncbi:UDP-N-acetylglucosamine 1-carboxyvinyltransferase [Benzoatithermus flavus]|uniref:UDP-N-acetylglucosamine 1-carboxyvinyltransferase n=1 Tax=Benzoatithermus flavus TaxID=3108223 RepID=A0ABU8XNW3_9PROT